MLIFRGVFFFSGASSFRSFFRVFGSIPFSGDGFGKGWSRLQSAFFLLNIIPNKKSTIGSKDGRISQCLVFFDTNLKAKGFFMRSDGC